MPAVIAVNLMIVDRKAKCVTSVTGKIRWKKELGRVPMFPGSKDPYPIPCGLFFAAALEIVAGAPGSFSHQTTVATITGLPNKAGPVPKVATSNIVTVGSDGLPISFRSPIRARD